MRLPKDEQNELRLIAAEIIRQLWETRNVGQLDCLRAQVKAALGDLERRGVTIPPPFREGGAS